MAFLDTLKQQVERSKQAFSKLSTNVLKAGSQAQGVAEKALPRYTAQVRGLAKSDTLSLTKDVADLTFKSLDALSSGVGNVLKEERGRPVTVGKKPVYDSQLTRSFVSGVKKRFQGDTSATLLEEVPTSLGINKDSLLGLGIGLMAEIALPGPGAGEKKAVEKGLGAISDVLKYIGSVNKERLVLNKGADKVLQNVYENIKPTIESALGQKKTFQEVIDLAEQSKVFKTVVTSKESLESAARGLKTRQNMTYLANTLEGLKKTDSDPREIAGVAKELTESLEVALSRASDRSFQLNAMKIAATKGEPELLKTIKQIIDKTGATKDKIKEIVEASKKVDFNNIDELTKFYRTYVKPSKMDILDEYRYINLLSNPRTHVVNAFTNLLQSTVRPIDKLASGTIDFVVSGLTGKERDVYVREVPEYVRGSLNAIPKAFKQMKAAFQQGVVERPDIIKIPTGKFPKLLTTPLRALNAADVFFRNIISGGEFESLVYREMKKRGTTSLAPDVVEGLRGSADDIANKYLFRKRTNAGVIDGISRTVREAGEKHRVLRWFVPFVETPAHILKEGIERTPGIGLVALKDAPTKADKIEILGRQAVGSSVLMAGAYLALSDKLTFAAPKGKNQSAAFYASGKQPYAVKIGDKWFQYSRLGPLAFPLSVAGAYKQAWDEDEKLQANGNEARGFGEKNVRALMSMSQFFADQSYIQSMGNLYDAVFDNDYSMLERLTANTISQVIPADALLGFATRIVDETYRNPDGIIDILKTQIPILSGQVEPYKTPSGKPSKRQNRFFNAIFPISVTEDKPVSGVIKNTKRTIKKPKPTIKKSTDKFASPTQ